MTTPACPGGTTGAPLMTGPGVENGPRGRFESLSARGLISRNVFIAVSTRSVSAEKSSTFATNLSYRYTATSSNWLNAPARAGNVLWILERDSGGSPVSTTTTAESGTGSLVKSVMVCRRPSSKMTKSCFARLVTSLSPAPFTVTGTTTRSIFARILNSCAYATAARNNAAATTMIPNCRGGL